MTKRTKATAATLNDRYVPDGRLRLFREPWGHYTVALQTKTGAHAVLGESDTFALARQMYLHLVDSLRQTA